MHPVLGTMMPEICEAPHLPVFPFIYHCAPYLMGWDVFITFPVSDVFSPHHLLSFGTRRNDVKRGLRNGVAPYIPAAFCRNARSAGHGATEAARPERSLQARGFHASDRSDSPKPRQRVRRRLAGAPAATCRSWA